jgi:hypothetical protein
MQNRLFVSLLRLALAFVCAALLVWYASGPAAAATEGVVWTNLVLAAADGSTIIDQSDGSAAAGGVSSQAIISGDGYMEHTIVEFNTNRAAGLSNGNSNEELNDIDFAIRFNGAGNAEIYEKGLYRDETTYASGNRFRVAVVGGQVRYSKSENDTSPFSVFYTSAASPTYPLLVDVSLMTAGAATISNTIISGNLSGSGSAEWPNEPAGFVPINPGGNQPWDFVGTIGPRNPNIPICEADDNLVCDQTTGWCYMRRTGTGTDTRIDDQTPFSPTHALRIHFPTDMCQDSEPSVHYIGLPTSPSSTEIYAAWWMKLSANWTCSPAGCGKITFLLPVNANGVTYSNLAGVNDSHYVNIATTWDTTGDGLPDYRFWEPQTPTPVLDDQWYRVEWYEKWASSSVANDGIIRWWVNGTLNGNYENVQFPETRGFTEFQYAPTRQVVPPDDQYLYIDHTRVSTP